MMNKVGPQTNVFRDYLEQLVGDAWIDYFNVEDYEYLLEYLDDE